MDTTLTRPAVLALALSLMGCGAQVATTAALTAPSSAPSAAAAVQPSSSAVAMTPGNETLVASEPVLDVASLPAAPWSGPPMTAGEAPRALMNAWRGADNRSSCAPIAPRAMGAADGARARSSRVAGGWAVEFDRAGLPGVDRDGNECDTCGRSVFGIAGTSMAPEELIESMSPAYSDGSHTLVEISDGDGESVASVTFTVAGQGCVYEVWSFLGPDHLSELVNGLRFVEPTLERGTAIASAD